MILKWILNPSMKLYFFDPVKGVYMSNPIFSSIPWDIMKICLNGGVIAISHIGYGKKFLTLYM